MRAYILRRLLLVIPTVFLASTTLFFIQRLMPGTMVDILLAEAPPFRPESRESIEQSLGVNAPWFTQYGRWLGLIPGPDGKFNGLIEGSLGNSLWKHRPVTSEILARWPVTLELGALALLFTVIISIPIGIYSAMRQDTLGDYGARVFATAAIAVPTFWLGIIIVVLMSLWWGQSPPLAPISLTEDPAGHLRQFLIPAAVMGVSSSGTIMRLTRSQMLEVLRQDYVRTAWSKGLKERVIVLRHAMKNALIPVITIVGGHLPVLVGGSVVTETVFNLPGMGRLLVEAIDSRDYPIVSGVIIYYAMFLVLCNLLVDMTYAYLHPKVRFK